MFINYLLIYVISVNLNYYIFVCIIIDNINYILMVVHKNNKNLAINIFAIRTIIQFLTKKKILKAYL